MKPRLRAHVEVQPHEGGARVRDGLLRQGFELGPMGAALLARVDGSRTIDELCATPEDATILRRLFLLNLLEGAGDAIVARIEALLSGREPLHIRVLEGARFECQGSGECCQNYVFGPLTEDDVARIGSLPIAEAFPGLAGTPLFDTIEEQGYRFRYLRSSDERCVFLEADRRCGLHRRFGAEAKPAICRMYPIEHLMTHDGLRLFDKGSCASFAVAARSGPALVDELPRLAALLPRHASALHHPPVLVDEYPCDFGHFDRFAKQALELVDANRGTAPETLRAISRGARGLAGVLRAFPLEAGQPERALDDFLAIDPVRWYEGEPGEDTVRSGSLFFSEIFAALLIGASNALSREQPSRTGQVSLRLVHEGARLFHLCSAATSLAVDPTMELGAEVLAILAVPVTDPAVDEVLRISLRQQLFGSGALVENRVAPALVRMALTQVMAVTGARLRAHEAGRGEARAEDLSWGHMLALRVLGRRDAAPVLLATEEKMTEILEALPLVLRLDLGPG